jgi:hypothetical protein
MQIEIARSLGEISETESTGRMRQIPKRTLDRNSSFLKHLSYTMDGVSSTRARGLLKNQISCAKAEIVHYRWIAARISFGESQS